VAWIKLRRFEWTTRLDAGGFPVVDTIESVSRPAQLSVDLSDLILTNALATTVSRPVIYDATQHELRLLGSYLHQPPYGQLCVREKSFRASALHIRRFVTESVGLGMLTAAVQAAYRWYGRGSIHNFDALPTALAPHYRRRGVRPDLLFDTPKMWLAGEARGRSHKPPASPATPQRKRLNELLPWAARHGHDLVMTWAYLNGSGITVDWFAEKERLPDLSSQVGVAIPEENLTLPADAESFSDRQSDASRELPEFETPYIQEEFRFDETGPSELMARARRRVDEVEQRLFTTAPAADAPIRIAGRSLRGRWMPLDLVGQSSGSLLFGLLASPLTREEGWDVTEGLRHMIRQRTDTHTTHVPAQELPPDPPATVSVRGRLLVAVAGPEFTEPWDLLAN
jgi:hypothetical protein